MKHLKKINGRKRSGFTMIELMLVIVIGVGLSAFVIPRFMDTKKMNEAREEAQKLSEFKARIESMFDFESDFSSLASIKEELAPSTYERAGSNLKSIWKQNVIVTGSNGQYQIAYIKVPTGNVCQEFVKNTKRQMWNSISVGTTSLSYESAPNAIVNACAGSTATSTIDITYTYQP